MTIYEKSDAIGGVWRYTPDPNDPHATPVYENLRINVPAECMGYMDFPFKTKSGDSFCGHAEVLLYLKEYAEKFNLMNKVKLSSEVENVEMIDDQWLVTVNQKTYQFDYVIVAIGRYTTIENVDFPPCFENNKFEGTIIPACRYRRPQDWTGKNVVVLGSAQSGSDISIELADHAKSVTLIGSAPTPCITKKINRLESEWIQAITESGIITTAERFVEADVIIVAAGYKYSFPFLKNILDFDSTG